MTHFTDALFEDLSEGLLDHFKKINKEQLQDLLLTQPVPIYYERRGFPKTPLAHYAVYRNYPEADTPPYYAVGTRSITGLEIEQAFTDQDQRGIDRLWKYIVEILLLDPEDYTGAYDYQDPRLQELKLLKTRGDDDF